MKLIFKYIKPFAVLIIACLVLLFAQAMCELELPNLMSDMVNTGIQAGGIEAGVPEVISADGYRLVSAFADEGGKTALGAAYTYREAGGEAKKNFPNTASTAYYELTEPSDEADGAYNRAVYAFVLSVQSLSADGSTGAASADATLENIDAEALYAMLEPVEQLAEAGAFSAQIAEAADGESLAAEQIAVTMTGIFYRELGASTDDLRSSYIWSVGLKMIGVALLSVAAAVGVGWCSSVASTRLGENIRHDVFKKVNSFSSSEMNRFSTASLITRTTNDVQMVQTLLTFGMRLICYSPIMAVGGIIMVSRTGANMSWIIVFGTILLILLCGLIGLLVMPKFKIIQKLVDKVNLISRENLTGVMVVRAFGNEQKEEQRFSEANGELRKVNLFTQRTFSAMMPVMTLIMNLITLLIIWVGSKQIAASTLQIGSMMAFMQYAIQIIMSFLMLAAAFIYLPRAMVSANRINEVLNVKPEIVSPAQPKRMGNPRGEIEFKNVSFRYGEAEEDVLKDISFVARPGETTAFIGSTGAGKSTLINLVPRFYDVSGGQVLFDGVDVREMDVEELRSLIGYVPQKGMLFSGGIAENIRFGKEDASDEEIASALEIAQGAFVYELDGGLEHEIAQGGTNVSGGQRQRLSIARAIVGEPKVYIFDDSFSALDLKTDAALRKALKSRTKDATTLIVAQRVSTIMNAEQIVVLDEGRMVGRGTHAELLKNCPEYREIAASQLSENELEGVGA